MRDDVALWLIPAAPLLASILIAIFGSFLKERSHWLCVAGLSVSVVVTALLLLGLGGVGPLHFAPGTVESTFTWIEVGTISIQVTLYMDHLTAAMLSAVTFVSLLVAIYASGYMHGDPGYPRFFAALSLFVFAMTSLVLAGNFLLLFVFWEAVGLCSFLLIGFWFERPSAAAAAKKAFVVNRIGDFGFLLGVFLLWNNLGSMDFQHTLFDAGKLAGLDHTTAVAICLLLFLGAVGKSAQFPLHVWLPDAMEGPTPVSALIHAATMVTAGVYLVARCMPLFALAPEAQMVVAGIGAVTALLAALIALTQHDLKRVMAYSTVSQLGYMFMALGCAAASPDLAPYALVAAIFHLFTHAFFKALLFLGSGSVMHAMGDVIDMRQFGGLRHSLKHTHWTFLCGCVALAGLPPFAGFWSKDEILHVIQSASQQGPYPGFFSAIFIMALVTSFLTAFYTFRAYFRTFHGVERFPAAAGEHPHESPPVMLGPLMILAVFSLTIGAAVGPTGLFKAGVTPTHSLGGHANQEHADTTNTTGTKKHQSDNGPHDAHADQHHEHAFDWGLALNSSVLSLSGLALAWAMYTRFPLLPLLVARALRTWYDLSYHRFYLDELYSLTIVKPLESAARVCRVIDITGFDSLVDGVGALPARLGERLRTMQNGLVQSYALVMFLGLGVLLAVMLRFLGG